MPMSPVEYASASADVARSENKKLSEQISKLEQRVDELEEIILNLIENKS